MLYCVISVETDHLIGAGVLGIKKVLLTACMLLSDADQGLMYCFVFSCITDTNVRVQVMGDDLKPFLAGLRVSKIKLVTAYVEQAQAQRRRITSASAVS